MLLLCDFDGTVTSRDVTDLLWDHFGRSDWKTTLYPRFRRGEITTLEIMDEGWRVVDRSETELLAYARAHTGLREGFAEFARTCAARGWPVHVISNGLDWYLRAFLPDDVPFTCYTAALEDGWRVRLPAGTELPPGSDFKIHVMRQLQAAHPGLETVFIGDGRNDLPVARACDRVFAIRGSTLARLCLEDGVEVEEFESFLTVTDALSRVAEPKRPRAPIAR